MRITITNCQRKVCMFIFIAQKNPRPKQARKIWSTSIWPPATRQNPHMNQSQFWPCRLSNRFQKYLTLWALESLCPICLMDFRPSQKERAFSCCKLSSSLIIPKKEASIIRLWLRISEWEISSNHLFSKTFHLYAPILRCSDKNYNQSIKRSQVLESICFYSINPNISMPAATATLSDSACPLIGI